MGGSKDFGGSSKKQVTDPLLRWLPGDGLRYHGGTLGRLESYIKQHADRHQS